MRVGVLDVGSNTARLLVADVAPGGEIVPVVTGKTYLGLGAEIAETGTLAKRTIARAAAVCGAYAEHVRELGCDRAEVIVTAPGRQGAASEQLVAALRDHARLPVRILSADDEGRLAYDGAIARSFDELSGVIGVVDVGGGSTEIVVGGPRSGPVWVRSVDLGSLRLSRFALPTDPPSKRELAEARETVRDAIAPLCPPRPDVALAVGGSARAVAKLVGRTFDADDVEAAVAILACRRSAKVTRAAGIDAFRAKTVLAGALLLAESARALDRPLALARGGLRDGVALAVAVEGSAVAA